MEWSRVGDYTMQSDCKHYLIAVFIMGEDGLLFRPSFQGNFLGLPTKCDKEAAARCLEHKQKSP